MGYVTRRIRHSPFSTSSGTEPATLDGATDGNIPTLDVWEATVTIDTLSLNQDPHFLNPTATPPNLKIDVTALTWLESGGSVVAGIDADFEGDIRAGSPGYNGSGTAPDIGADEFGGQRCSSVEDGLAPRVFALHAPYPNPAQGSVSLEFDVPTTSDVQIEIFGVDGRRISELMHGPAAPARYKIAWRGRDSSGRPMSSGVYFVRMRAKGFEARRKLVWIRN